MKREEKTVCRKRAPRSAIVLFRQGAGYHKWHNTSPSRKDWNIEVKRKRQKRQATVIENGITAVIPLQNGNSNKSVKKCKNKVDKW